MENKEEKEGLDISMIINWIISIGFLILVVYLIYTKVIGCKCNCQATYEAICNTVKANMSNINLWVGK